MNLHVCMEIMRPALFSVKTAGISYFGEQALSQTVRFPEIICLPCPEAVCATGKITTSGDNHPSKWRISGIDPQSSAACVGYGWSRTCGQDNMSRGHMLEWVRRAETEANGWYWSHPIEKDNIPGRNRK